MFYTFLLTVDLRPLTFQKLNQLEVSRSLRVPQPARKCKTHVTAGSLLLYVVRRAGGTWLTCCLRMLPKNLNMAGRQVRDHDVGPFNWQLIHSFSSSSPWKAWCPSSAWCLKFSVLGFDSVKHCATLSSTMLLFLWSVRTWGLFGQPFD